MSNFLALSTSESAFLIALAEGREPESDKDLERALAARGLIQFSGTRDMSQRLEYQAYQLTPGGAQVADLLTRPGRSPNAAPAPLTLEEQRLRDLACEIAGDLFSNGAG